MRPQIRVMHILHTLGIGGLEKGVVNLANKLNSKGFEISICCLEASGVFESRLSPGVKVFVLHKSKGIDYTLPLRLAGLFRRERTMIVHTHNVGTYLYGAIAAKLLSRVKLVHGEHGDLLQPSGCRWRDLTIRRCFSYMTDMIHTVSADMRHTLICMVRVNPRKAVAILNGVELEKFDKMSVSQCRRTLGIGSNEFVIGTVGRLSPVKNFELLIQVIPELNRAGIYPKVLLVGDGPSRPNLESLAKQYHLAGQVFFLGSRSDVPELLNAMDIFVLPSLSEGLSNSILEAMAAGVPVIASDVGGNSELVLRNETGFLFPPQDKAMLAQRILQLAIDPEKRRRMGMLGCKRAERLFSLEVMIGNYERLYRDVLRNREFGFG